MKMKLLFLVGTLVLSLSLFASENLLVWCEPHKLETITSLAEEWSQKTGVEVDVEPVSVLETANKVQLAGPVGKGPDVFCCLSGQLALLVNTGTIAPIDAEKCDLSHFMKNSVSAATIGGKLYGIPYDVSTVALIYNIDLWPQAPKTFEELIEWSQIRRQKGEYGLLWPLENFYYSYAFIAGFGGYIFGKNHDGQWNSEDIGLATEEAEKALQLLLSLRKSDVIPVGVDALTAQTLFVEQRAAAIIDGPWVLSEIKKSGINFDVVPIPPFENGLKPAPFVSFKWWHISSYSTMKEKALEFINFITSKDAMYKSYINAEGIPPRLDVLNLPEVSKNPEVIGFGLQASLGSVVPDIPAMNVVWVPMNRALELALKEEESIADALRDAVSIIVEDIAEMQ